jgi:type I restriction enzyme, S subunit
VSEAPQFAVDPWLGPLPPDWTVKRLGALGELIKGRGGSKEDNRDAGVPVVRYGDLYTKFDTTIVEPAAFVSEEDAAKYTPLAKHSLVFAASGESAEDIGKSALSLLAEPAVVGGDAVVFHPDDEIDPLYLAYTLESTPMRSYKAIRSTGFTVVHISAGKLKTLPIPCPPRPVQRVIADYLDRETARIDTLIEEQQRLTEMLRERRHSVLAHALSGGGPRVPFVRCMTEQVDYRGATPRKTDDGVQLVTARNVKAGWIDYETSQEFIDPAEYAEIMHRGLPRIGDLLFTMEAPLGNVAVVDREDIALAQRVIKWSVDRSKAEPRFLMYAALGDDFQEQLLARATGSTALGVKASKLPELRIDLPSLEEQRSIITHLDEQAAKIDTLIAETQRFIELSKERRSALITAAVTGQIDVREMA